MTPSPGTSLEARELLAAGALRLDADEARARALDAPPPEHPVAFPPTASLAADANRSAADDPWRAALLAEAHVAGARRRPWERLARSARKPLSLRGDAHAVTWDAAPYAIAVERNAARREALRAASDDDVAALREPARAVIDALRGAVGALDATLAEALALGGEGHGDLLRELDAWALRSLGLDRARLTWADRLHTLSAPSTLAALPPATWPSLGARLFERTGLDGALRGVVDDLRPASPGARGVATLVTAPGERAVVVGRPVLSGYGAGDVMGALAVAAASTTGRGPFPGVRRGRDRAVDGVAHALGRRLLVEREFLRREGVDGASRERVMLEAVHAEVVRVRLDAALARFVAHALAKAPEPGARFHAELTRALGAAPPPSWAPWVAATALDGAGLWPARPGGRALGARVEPSLVAELRARFDEDWFRNPRAGAGLRAALDEMRAAGVRAWCDARKEPPDAKHTAARLAEALREARRAT